MRPTFCILICLALSVGAPGYARALNAASPADIHRILENRIDAEKRSLGIVVGLLDSRGRRIVSYGNVRAGDSQPPTGDTVF